MDFKKIKEKIKKLLALSGSDNVNEAKQAMERAQEMMIKYNIEMNQVEGTTDKEYVVEYTKGFKREAMDEKFILDVITRFFYIDLVKTKRFGEFKFAFVGEKQNVETALYVRNFLKTTFKRVWNKYKKDNNAPNKAKQSFYCGLWLGLTKSLAEQLKKAEEEHGKALVLVKDPNIEKKVKEEFGDGLKKSGSKAIRTGDAEAKAKGYEEGKKIKIGERLNEGSQNPKEVEQAPKFW